MYFQRQFLTLVHAGECIGLFLHVEVGISSPEECLQICKETKGCKWFTHDQSLSSCLLMADCNKLDETCTDCISGESSCKGQDCSSCKDFMTQLGSYLTTPAVIEIEVVVLKTFVCEVDADPQGVNFAIILRATFAFESVIRSFSVL